MNNNLYFIYMKEKKKTEYYCMNEPQMQNCMLLIIFFK